MPTLKFYALGSPRLEQSIDVIPFGRRKALAMLAYLAITGQPQTRESLLALLWPEYDPSGGRANLRRDLSYLRRTLDEAQVVADRTQVSLNLEAGLWVDVRHFRSLLATAQEHDHGEEQLCGTCEEALTEAAELYVGDFMAGFSLPDAPDFDEWLFFEREGLRQELTRVLVALIRHHSHAGEYEAAITCGRRWLSLDPLHEPAHRELMKLYAWSGQQAAALRQYEECVRLLDEELGIAPEEETAMLYEKIRLRQLEAPLLPVEPRPERAVTTSPPGPETSAAEALTPLVTPSSAHNLPFQATPFIGREDELAELEELLSNPQKRLISIVAPGGMGKTRLSLAAAEGHLEMGQYPDGVYFIALAPLSDPDHIPAAMADAFDLPLETGGQTRTSRQQVLDYLREKRLLLVMDNFEHLLVGAELVNDVIQGAPQVQVIVTSRERLQLRSEQVYAIQGLEFPEWETPEEAAEYTAVKLFLQSAAQVQQDFQLEQDDLTYLSRICRLVGGMPLAIELAAGWVDTLSLEEIAAEIRQSLDFLETELRDVPERQRSIHAVFESSWERMGNDEQAVFPRLSRFRGGFTRPAGQAISGASLRTLSALVNKSLLQYDRKRRRYQIHELLRQFAAEKLAGGPDLETEVAARHSDYYCQALADREKVLKGEGQKEALAEIEADLENVRAAWTMAVNHEHLKNLSKAAEPLGLFHEWRGRYEGGRELFRMAAAALEGKGEPASLRLRAYLLAWQSVFSRAIGEFDEARRLLALSEDLMARPELVGQDLRREQAFVNLQQGYTEIRDLVSERSRAYFQKSLDLARDNDDIFGMASALEGLGTSQLHATADVWQEIDEALTEGLALRRALGDLLGTASILERLSNSARYQGIFELAEQYSLESLQICRELGGPANLAIGQESLGMTLIHLGRFAEAEQLLRDTLAIRKELGDRGDALATTTHRLALSLAGRGAFGEARELEQQALRMAREIGQHTGYYMWVIGWILLAEERDYEEAEQYVSTGYSRLREEGSVWQGAALASLGMAARGLGQQVRAQQCACEALRATIDSQNAVALFYTVLPAAIILLLDESEVEWAVVLDALATARSPNYANSAETVRGPRRLVSVAAATSPAEVRGRAEARGRELDPWQAAAELLEFMTEHGWNSGVEVIGSIGETRERAEAMLSEGGSRAEQRRSGPEQETAVAQMIASEPVPSPAITRNLPVQTTPFLGRKEELDELAQLIADPDVRLVTIVGPGGVGKTRLSLVAAERAVNFPDGVYFVPLAPIEAAANIVSAIAKTLNYRFFGEREPWRQILAYLAHKRMLLLMDNFEHLLDDGAALVAEMIQEAPAVKLLTTSRERLHLTGEAVYRIAGLPYPEDPAGPVTAENLKQYGAVALLLQQARLMRPGREPGAAELLEVARVCRLVQGMPLAIILAAGWLEMLSFKEIGDEIASNLDILESENRDLPSRQRSVHAAFAHSWQRLSPDEQVAFMKLSVFQGGFSRRAAGEIAGASLRLLRALVEKSLLVSPRPERYEVHELLRQFAAEKLAESGAETETRTAHSAYCLRALANLELDIKGRRQVEAVAEIDAELDNVRAAWIWAVRQRMERSVDDALEALYLHFFIRGRYQEGAALLHLARRAWEEPQGNRFLARIIAREFWLRIIPPTDDPQFEPDLNTSLEVAQAHGDQFEAAFATFARGFYLSRIRGDDEAAIPFFEASRAQFQVLGDDFYLAWALVRLGYAESNVAGRRDASQEHTRQGLELARETGNKMQVAWASMNLAGFLLNDGDFRGTERLYNEASSVAAETGFTQILPQVDLKLGTLDLLLHGDLAQAKALAIDALRSAREIGYPPTQAYALALLALEAGLSGDHARALRLGQESLEHPSNPRAEWNAHWAMSIANCGLERIASARRELLYTLRQTIDFQWQGLMTRLLPVAALLEYRAGIDSRAVELLSLAMHSPLGATGWIEVWVLAAEMRADLERKLEAAEFQRAWERGKGLDLETAAGELLARFSE